jgi:hypothetical protein
MRDIERKPFRDKRLRHAGSVVEALKAPQETGLSPQRPEPLKPVSDMGKMRSKFKQTIAASPARVSRLSPVPALL